MQQGICNPEFYGNFRKSFLLTFSGEQGLLLGIMRQTVCLGFNPIMVEGYVALFSCTAVALFSCTAVVQASYSMTASM